MMQNDAKYIRKTIQVPADLDTAIEEIASSTKRSFSYVCCLLLRQALNEKKRKKRGSKTNNNPEDHASDVGKGDGK